MITFWSGTCQDWGDSGMFNFTLSTGRCSTLRLLVITVSWKFVSMGGVRHLPLCVFPSLILTPVVEAGCASDGDSLCVWIPLLLC